MIGFQISQPITSGINRKSDNFLTPPPIKVTWFLIDVQVIGKPRK